MATNNMHNLTTLIKRLEAATSRLEDIASSTIELPQPPQPPQPPQAPQAPQALPALSDPAVASSSSGPSSSSKSAAVATSLPPPGPPPSSKLPAEPLPASIEDFDAFLDSSVTKYANISAQIGGLVAEQAAKVVQGFQEERRFLLITTKARKPNMTVPDDVDALQALLKPINETLMAVANIKESNRGSPVSNQLSTVADGIYLLAWVTDEGRPHKHVENTLGSAQYYGNRVLKDNRDKDPQQVEWVQAFLHLFRDLTDYIKQHFPSGIPWNPKGQPVQEVVRAMAAAPAPAAGGAPPPPPPPGPPPVLQINETEEAPKAGGGGGGFGAVFSELNKGEAVTRGLRKVDKSEMTHKNPSLRASSTVPDRDGSARGKSPAPGKKPKPESMRVKKPPVKALEGNKWTVENFDREAAPIEIEASLAHSVLISKCSKSTIIVRGKANAVTVENTSRLNLIVDSLVSTVDVVKSQNFAMQVMGQIPTVMMDQVDGAQVYFSKESTSTKIIHSKSANINLNVISGPDEDYVEVPLPSQISSYYDAEKGELVDEIVSHAG